MLIRPAKPSHTAGTFDEYREARRRREDERKDTEAAQEAVLLPAGETAAGSPRKHAEKKKDGRPPCNIIVLLCIILYVYMEGIYSSRAIARACRRNINFMYLLNGSPAPSHGRINGFRKHILGRAGERLFYEMTQYLGRCGETRFENIFIDGTQWEARATRHTTVWRKNLDRYEAGQRDKVMSILRSLNAGEGAYSLEEAGLIQTARVAREGINEALQRGEGEAGISRRTLKGYRKELLEGVKKLEKYRKQREIMGKRNSFSKTDPDAAFMRMKDQSLKAAYNVQLATEGEYITGAGIFGNPNDGTNLKPFLQRLQEMLGKTYHRITADAGYESEENYAYLAEHKQQAYIPPRDYRIRKTKKYKNDISKRENMSYDAEKDEYTCGNKRKLVKSGTERRASKSGYESEVTIYVCESCSECPLREKCTKSKTERRLEVSKKLLEYRGLSEERISSEEGKVLRVNRSIQAEGVFGAVKEDRHFRRFLLRGKAGTQAELMLLCIGYNVNKLHHKIQQDRCGTSLHAFKQAG